MEHRAYNQRSEIRSQRSESTILILFLKSEIRNSQFEIISLLPSGFAVICPKRYRPDDRGRQSTEYGRQKRRQPSRLNKICGS